MAGRYASNTSVSVENTRAEIERTLTRYGADAFMYATEGRSATVMFRMGGKQYKFALVLPDPKSKAFTHHSRGARAPEVARREWEQACRSKWRALGLVIKAKLEAVAAEISTVEDEFLAHLLLPNRETVGEWIKPRVEEAYALGHMPTSLMLEGPKQ